MTDDTQEKFRKEFRLRIAAYDGVMDRLNAEFGCALAVTCHAAPVQVEGYVEGKYLYFRARWEEWQLAIARDQNQAVQATIELAHLAAYYAEGEAEGDEMASWMSPEETERILRRSLAEYLGAG